MAVSRTGPGLRDLLVGLVTRLDTGDEPERLDRELDRELPSVVGEVLLAEAYGKARASIARVLRPGRDVSDASVRRAAVDHLRHSLELPRLAHCEDDRGRVVPPGKGRAQPPRTG